MIKISTINPLGKKPKGLFFSIYALKECKNCLKCVFDAFSGGFAKKCML